MGLSYTERVLLANQYKILSYLDERESGEYDKLREALEEGFEPYYNEALRWRVYDRTVSEEDGRMVLDSLDVYWAMQRSYEELEDKSGIDEKRLDFPGFDGNNEGKFYSYAEFVVEREGRWAALKFQKDRQHGGRAPGHDRYNSHMPTLDMYRAKIQVWKDIPPEQRFALDKDQILSILEARP